MRCSSGFLLLVVLCAILAPGLEAESPAVRLPAFFVEDSPSRLVGEASGMHAVFSREGVDYRAGASPEQARWIRARFLGSSAGTQMSGGNPAGQANFLIGQDPHAWRTGLPAYREILYHDLYPGIDLAYRGTGGQFKSEFRVAPGADPRQIRVAYSADLSLDAEGGLHMGSLQESAPSIYQETGAGRVVPVDGRYRLLDAHTAGFEIGAYDRTRPLVIDPVISYATYLGGSGLGAVTGVALDAAGDLYATGWTEALNFPTVGAVQATNLGGVDAFVVKVNPTGSALIYATYIGGMGTDQGAAIAVDSAGQAHVAGWTASGNFPLASALQALMGGSQTAFVLTLNGAGNALVFSTYLGGSVYDLATAIAVDAAGNSYVAGDTQSSNFPLLHPAQSAFGGGTDAFVSKLTPAGALAYSTFLGGAGAEHAGGIAVDSGGNMYVAGGTYSANFPVVAGAIQAAAGGGQDAFVSKLAAAGSAVVYSTYLGGNGSITPEQANAIAVDASGNAYVTGVTNSSNFPVTTGAYQTAFNGVSDAFLAKINAAGSALTYSTYLGGSDTDWASGVGLDSAGNAYVAGYTSSVDFPQVNAVQSGFGGFSDAFVSEIGPAGNTLVFSTYFGGGGSDAAYALAVDKNGNMFIGGQTGSSNLPLAGPIQSANSGGSVGWLARLGVTAAPPQLPSVTSLTPASGSGNTVVFTAAFSDSGGVGALTAVSLLVNGSANTTFACSVGYNPSANVFTLANDNSATGSQTVVPGGGTVQNSQCMLNGAGSTVTRAGNSLTMSVSLTFLPGFAGAQTVYLYASDAGANTGWVSAGAWTVVIPPPQPSLGTVSPNANSGSVQTFTFVFSDSQNAANLTTLGMLVAPSVTFASACALSVNPQTGTVGLMSDNGSTTTTRLLGSGTILQNSQCAVGATALAVSGLSDLLTVTITFKGAFDGVQNIYMYAANAAANTGWSVRGTYYVLAGGVPVVNSVVPSSGAGPAARFTFTVSDPGGAGYLSGMEVLIAPTLSTLNACYLAYDVNSNTVALYYQNPANGETPVTPGSSQTATNFQCELSAANTTVIVGTTSLIVTLDLYFNSAWYGPQNIYVRADASTTLNSGWVTVGTWTVTGGAPSAISVSPSSGSGSTAYFTFTVSDSSAQYNISGMSMLFTPGAPTNLANACYLVYNRTNSTIGLYDDSGTVLTTKIIGSAMNMQNTQCTVGYAVMYTSGTTVQFTVQLVFFAPFAGTQTVYLQANEPGANSGWVQRGTWTIP